MAVANKFPMGDIVYWHCKPAKGANTIVMVTPEFYENFYEFPFRITAYDCGGDADYVLTAFKRGFTDPMEVVKDLASLVKKFRKQYARVIIVGHSKAGPINIAMLPYLTNDDYDLMVNISSPYLGTVLASSDGMYKISSHKKFLGFEYGKILFRIYRSIFDGGPPDQIIQEDSPFLKHLDYSKIDKAKFFNITAKVESKSLLYDIRNFDIVGLLTSLGLLCLDRLLGLNGDGFIPLASQKANMEGVRAICLCVSHGSSYRAGVKKILEYLNN